MLVNANSSYLPDNDKLVRCLTRIQQRNQGRAIPGHDNPRILRQLQQCMTASRSDTRGLGLSPSTVSALATVGVLVAILVAMPIVGSLSQKRR